MRAIPECTYSIREAEVVLGLPYNTAYRLIREGKLEETTGPTGQRKVAREEVKRYLRKQEKIKEAKNY